MKYSLPLLLITLLLTGCGGQGAEYVVYKYQVAYMKQDREEAKKYCTQNFIDNHLPAEHEMGGLTGGGRPLPAPDDIIPTYDEFSSSLKTSEGRGVARVQIEQPFCDDVVYVLVHDFDGWKIDSLEWVDE